MHRHISPLPHIILSVASFLVPYFSLFLAMLDHFSLTNSIYTYIYTRRFILSFCQSCKAYIQWITLWKKYIYMKNAAGSDEGFWKDPLQIFKRIRPFSFSLGLLASFFFFFVLVVHSFWNAFGTFCILAVRRERERTS